MKNHKKEKHKIFSRRALILSSAKIAMLGVLGARLYYLQVSEGDKYKLLSEDNRIKLIPVIPRRGDLIDRSGNIISMGLPRYQLHYNPSKSHSNEENLKQISEIIDIPQDKIDEILEKIKDPKTKFPIVIQDYVPWSKIAKFQVNSNEIENANLHFSEVRKYPFGETAGLITGYVGAVSEKDRKDNAGNPLYGEKDYSVGKAGLELSLNDKLKGNPGFSEIEVDSRGRYIRELDYRSFERGEDIQLTIDIHMQEFVKQQLSGKGGIDKEGAAAVLMDISNGDVLAMASVPDYDPNKFIGGISSTDWQAILNDPDKPLINKAVSKEYSPGSTFKPIVALAALEEGIIIKDTIAYCEGNIEFGDRKFHCWKKEGHGEIDLMQAITQSCNVYFYELAKILGLENIDKYARKFGFGEKTGIELPFEKNGLFPTRGWKKRTFGEPWFDGETLNTSIGQGYILNTPLQLATATARIASGGLEVSPRMVVDENNYYPQFSPIEGITSKNVNIIKEAMAMVVNHPRGTVFRHRIDERKYWFAGKTGTVQVKDKRFTKTPKNRQERNHAVFIGFAPVKRPRFAIAVIVEHGGYGSSSAAPIAREILLEAQKKYLG